MPIALGSNISSRVVQRQLNRSTRDISAASERLASGQRINKASDDAAGLAISKTLDVKSAIYGASLRNLNDGISAINIADGVYGELSGIVTRIMELAEQAANGVYSTAQRRALDNEAQALSDEYQRVIASTKFNGISLLGTSSNSIRLQVGVDGTANSQLNVNFGTATDLGGTQTQTVGNGTLGSATNYTTGAGAVGVSIVDVNNDSILDILSVSDSTTRAYVQFGNGNGTFQAAVSYQTGANPQGIVTGDFNGDGFQDFVVSEFGVSSISLFLNNGNGTFAARVSTIVGAQPTDIKAGDIDRDGDTDIVVSLGGDNRVRIITNNGTGTFTAGNSYFVGSNPQTVALADLNGDNYLDAVTASMNNDNISVLLNNGSGSLGSATNYASGDIHFNGEVTAADLDGDGDRDLAVAARNSDAVYVYTNSGNGSFAAGVSYYVNSANNISAADMNGDGVTDLVVSGFSSGSINILTNSGTGTFSATVSYTGLSGPKRLAAADLNKDGALDIVATNFNINVLSVFAGNTQTIEGLPAFSLLNKSDALDALSSMQSTLASIAQARGSLGATMARLNTAFNNNSTGREAAIAASARITSTDVAQESAALIAAQIKQKVAASVLAQANQAPVLAVTLLRS